MPTAVYANDISVQPLKIFGNADGRKHDVNWQDAIYYLWEIAELSTDA